jgi:hypothetical protein
MGNSTFMLIYLISVSYISCELAEFDLARQYLVEVRALRETIPGPTMSADDIEHIERAILNMKGEWEQVAESVHSLFQNPPDQLSPLDLDREKLVLANSMVERELYDEALKVLDSLGLPQVNEANSLQLLASFLQANCHTCLGQLEQASQAIKLMDALPFEKPHFPSDIYSPLAKAGLLAFQGEREQEDTLYQSVVEYTLQHKLRWYRARVLLHWARVDLMTKRSGADAQVRAHLELARELFASIKALGYVRRINHLLTSLPGESASGKSVD